MNFFARQAQARTQTRRLVILFIIALLAVLVAVNLVILTLVASAEAETLVLPDGAWIASHPGSLAFESLPVLAVVGLSSLYKSVVLRGGGGVVARSLGGTRLERDIRDPLRRRLYNVVEEMAIASSVPMPEVYVLDQEPGINAFAAVSRQREVLADSSAVQFTREPQGLKGALVKIGGFDQGSRLQDAGVDEVAHMLFAAGMSRLFATHPPLIERIRSLDPSFRESEFARVDLEPQVALGTGGDHLTSESLPTLDADIRGLAASPVAAQPEAIVRLVGNPGTREIEAAQAVARSLPAELLTDLEGPGRALGLLLALVLDPKPEVRARQVQLVKERIGDQALTLIERAETASRRLAPIQRLPLLQQVFPSLRRLPREDRRRIVDGLNRLILVDGRIEIFEYALGTLARMYLRDELEPAAGARALRLNQVSFELQVVFSTLAWHGAEEDGAARRAFEMGMHHVLPMLRPSFAPVPGWPAALDRALKCLDRLLPAAKERLVEALVKTIAHDQRLTIHEGELLRAICASLHCPLPPLAGLRT